MRKNRQVVRAAAVLAVGFVSVAPLPGPLLDVADAAFTDCNYGAYGGAGRQCLWYTQPMTGNPPWEKSDVSPVNASYGSFANRMSTCITFQWLQNGVVQGTAGPNTGNKFNSVRTINGNAGLAYC